MVFGTCCTADTAGGARDLGHLRIALRAGDDHSGCHAASRADVGYDHNSDANALTVAIAQPVSITREPRLHPGLLENSHRIGPRKSGRRLAHYGYPPDSGFGQL